MDDKLQVFKDYINGTTPIPGPTIRGFPSVVGIRNNCSEEECKAFNFLIDYIENLETRIKQLEDNYYPNEGTYNDTERH